MIRSHWFARLRGIILCWGLLITLTCLTPAPAPAQSSDSPPHSGRGRSGGPNDSLAGSNVLPPPMSAKQKQSIMQANFEKSKSDAAELAAMAKRLREELDKPNADVLSFQVMNRIDKIEKLAKKIRDETKGY